MVKNYLRTGTPFDYDANDADDLLLVEFDEHAPPTEEDGSKLFEEED
jgi:hypothetical protein